MDHSSTTFETAQKESIREALLLVTVECNNTAGCIFCCERGTEADSSIDDIKKMIDQLINVMKFNLIDLNGGEPLLRKNELFEIMSYIKNRGCEVSLSTNILELDDDFIIEMRNYTNVINVSLHGANRETHESLFQVRNSFDLICGNISKLVESGFYVHVTMVVTNTNIDEVLELADLCYEKGVATLCLNKVFGRGHGAVLLQDNQPSDKEIMSLVKTIEEKYQNRLMIYGNYSRTGQCILIRPDGNITGAPIESKTGLIYICNIFDSNLVEKWENYPYIDNHRLYCEEKFKTLKFSSLKEF